MPKEDDVLRVGDVAEFHRMGNPQPDPEWDPQVVTEICVVEDACDKEGVPVSQLSWRAIRNYECLVVVSGTGNWAHNDQIRPVSKIAGGR
jgi:hypothetical protein